MSKPSLPGVQQKKDWTLTSSALDRLLIWLDEGRNSEGQRYLEMRRRLSSYFDRKNCSIPDELADETLNRVARRLQEDAGIGSEIPAKYCYIVARFVFMEHLRAQEKDEALRRQIQRQQQENNPKREIEIQNEIKEKMLYCLEQCTGKLAPSNRELILRYYIGKERVKIENRRALAESLGMTMNALSIRACRIRDELEACVKTCVARNEMLL